MTSLEEISEKFRGLPVTKAAKGTGSFIAFDIGQEGPTSGSHLHVWVQYCAWTMHRGEHLVLTSESADNMFPAALSQLLARNLASIVFDSASQTIEMAFTSGCRLCLHADPHNYDVSDELVTFFERDGDTVSVSPSRGVYVESGP